MPGHDQSRRCYTFLQRLHADEHRLWPLRIQYYCPLNHQQHSWESEVLRGVSINSATQCIESLSALPPLDYFHPQPALLLWALAARGQIKPASLPCRCWSARSYWGTSPCSLAQQGLSRWPHCHCSVESQRAWRAAWCQWADCPPRTWKSSNRNRQIAPLSFLPLTRSHNMQAIQKVLLEKYILTNTSNDNGSS